MKSTRGKVRISRLTFSERIGLKYIYEKEGCEDKSVMRGTVGEPDFIVPSGQRYEVKMSSRNANDVGFGILQVQNFRDDDIILVVENGYVKYEVSWGSLLDVNKTVRMKAYQVPRIIKTEENIMMIEGYVFDVEDIYALIHIKDEKRITATLQYRVLSVKVRSTDGNIDLRKVIRVVDKKGLVLSGISTLAIKEMGEDDVMSLYQYKEWRNKELQDVVEGWQGVDGVSDIIYECVYP